MATCEISGCARHAEFYGVCRMHYMRMKRRGSYDDPPRAGRSATPAQLDIVARLSLGATQQQVADARNVSRKTIEKQVLDLRQRCGAYSARQLVAMYCRGEI